MANNVISGREFIRALGVGDKVYKVEIVADVNDVARMKIHRFVTADIAPLTKPKSFILSSSVTVDDGNGLMVTFNV